MWFFVDNINSQNVEGYTYNRLDSVYKGHRHVCVYSILHLLCKSNPFKCENFRRISDFLLP